MNIVRKIRLQFAQWKYEFLRKLVYKYGRTISVKKTDWDTEKEKFERNILKILKKYQIIDNKHGIQGVEIIVDVNEYPTIKIKTTII